MPGTLINNPWHGSRDEATARQTKTLESKHTPRRGRDWVNGSDDVPDSPARLGRRAFAARLFDCYGGYNPFNADGDEFESDDGLDCCY
jgi:hypothetical protein